MEKYVLLIYEAIGDYGLKDTILLALSFSEGKIYEGVVQRDLAHYFGHKYNLEYVSIYEEHTLLITDLSHLITRKNCSIVSVSFPLKGRDYQNIEKAIRYYS